MRGFYTERANAYTQGEKSPDAITRPEMCPSCRGRVIDTLAKVVTATTTWRCRGCEHTWRGAGIAATPSRQPR